MKGTVVKRGAKYAVVLDLGLDPNTGRRRQKWHSGYGSRKEAEKALPKLVGSVNDGVYVPKSKQTVAEFAAEWLAAIEPTVRPSTHYSYARNLRLHVVPYIGSAKLSSVDAGVLNGLYARLLRDGKRNGEAGGLSPRSVRYLHTIVHRMLKDGVRWGRLVRNAADSADPPRLTSTDAAMVTWSAEQTRTFLVATADDRLGAAFLLLATTGARRGEVLGLRWRDVDLDAGRISIRQTVIAVHHTVHFGDPKTARGRRTISLDAETVAALREHRRRQAAERLAAETYVDHDLVFCRIDGAPLHPERFTRTFLERSAGLGLPRIRLHDLRHGWATLALASGVHPKIVQERLGHATVAITLGTYSHVSEGMHSEAAEQVAGVIFGGR